jgi:ferritin-like metal-binding protein YciE
MASAIEKMKLVQSCNRLFNTDHLLPAIRALTVHAHGPIRQNEQTVRLFPFVNETLVAPQPSHGGVLGKFTKFKIAKCPEQRGLAKGARAVEECWAHWFLLRAYCTGSETAHAGAGPKIEDTIMSETSNDVITRYLEDAIAAEKSFETQLQGFAKEGDNTAAKSAFQQHAVETKRQYERLTARLEALGGSTSTAKSLLAHMFNMTPKAAQIGHEKEERTTQNLMMAFAVENSELAMYESLASVAEAAGDTQTAALAREIQAEEKATADKVWKLLGPAALDAYTRITGGASASGSARSASTI